MLSWLVIVVAKAMISKPGPVLSRYRSCKFSELTFISKFVCQSLISIKHSAKLFKRFFVVQFHDDNSVYLKIKGGSHSFGWLPLVMPLVKTCES